MADSVSKVYAEIKWICSNCKDGPHSMRYDAYCPSCSHQRCSYCEQVKIVYRR